MLTDYQKERLTQWCNVYGGSDQCVAAAQADKTLQSLLQFEMESDDIDEAARVIRQRITGIEVCHRACKRNVEGILSMIGEMKAAHVAGCGETDAGLVAELRDTMAAAAAWADGKADEVGSLSDVLGERTPAKRWLVACLCKTLAQQLAGYQGDEPLAQPHWPAHQ